MKKTIYIIIALALIISIGIVFFSGLKNNTDSIIDLPTQNVQIKDGIQYITINAKGGYSPRVSIAKAGIPTKLIVKTNGTYDCSASLIIRSIGYQKILSQTGEEVIDLDIPQSGTLQGFCSMGVHNFKINFN